MPRASVVTASEQILVPQIVSGSPGAAAPAVSTSCASTDTMQTAPAPAVPMHPFGQPPAASSPGPASEPGTAIPSLSTTAPASAAGPAFELLEHAATTVSP